MTKHFEVEVRCHFDSIDEAYRTIPFLSTCLCHKMVWSSSFYGQGLFKSGQILRLSMAIVDDETKYYLGWKSRDFGSFANIREEIDEIITNGISDSEILNKLGSQNINPERRQIAPILRYLGHRKFMSFKGRDLLGKYEPLDLDMKLMNCSLLRWPILVEIEKLASTMEEALVKEKELRKFCEDYHLSNRLVREEPPTLLYETRLPQGQQGV